MTASDPIVIKVYRPLNGLRTPYKLILDNARNVLSFDVDFEELARIHASASMTARHTLRPAVESHAETLAQQGLVVHVTDRGLEVSREPLDEWGQGYEIWMDPRNPNPFPGTDELREQWTADLKDTQVRIEEGTCPGCEINRLKVDYRIKLRALQATP